jgi:chemotaxis protein MotB
MKVFNKFLIVSILAASMSSCVPQQKFAELDNNYKKSEQERNYLSGAVKDLESEKKELTSRNASLQKNLDEVTGEMDDLKLDVDRLKNENRNLTTLKNQLVEQLSQSSANNKAENQKLLNEMIRAQEDLQRKEDELKRKEAELNKLAAQLEGTRKDLQALDADLKKREARINELEQMIAEKDAAVKALKDKITAALLNFKDKGLTVTQKNGRIYVSMEAKLLFPSGSTTINTEGKSALVQLSKILEKQEDITILVEGHTDTDPMSGKGCIKDNWELSVMRATAVVKLMMNSSKIDPALLTAAGRSEYLPIDPKDKAKNRRIEIILTPNLDKLFEILDEEAAKIEQTVDPNDEESDDASTKPE